MAIPTDPNSTRGRASTPEATLSFPLTETLSRSTRLRFVAYSRWSPNDTPTENTTALITLPMPISIPDNSSIRTSRADLGVWGNVNLSALNKSYEMWSLDPLKDAWDVGVSVAKDQIQRMEENFKVSGLKALALSPLMNDGDTKRNLQLAAGVITNPHTTIIFEGVELRSFTLSWRLSPRSLDESNALKQICDTIKLRSHPAESFRGYALDYPDLCYVEFVGDSADYLPRFHKAFVNNITINTGAGNGLAFYNSGAPIEQEVTVSLTEVNILTRDILEEDFQ